MKNHVGAALLASVGIAGLPVGAAPQPHNAGATLLTVPYVSQEERLCGGAAAAMLMRASGSRGVYAEDFAPLVDEQAGGIHTTDLAAALRGRGFRIAVSNGTADAVRQHLARGRPVLVLLEDRPGRYHYVVVVGWSADAVVYHDPARAPYVTRAHAQFDAAWRVTQRWMLVIETPPATESASQNAGRSATDVAFPSPEREAAMQRFVERDYAAAARMAERAARAKPDDVLAWRLAGASRYLAGDTGGALDAWNHAGDPRIDLIEVDGLSRTPHRGVERLIGLAPGATLTRSVLVRAERRLALLPAGQTSRVTYTALPGNLAEVRGAIIERPLVPSRLEWIATAARLPIDRELSLSFGNAASAGDRLTAAWRFWSGRPRVSVGYQFPAPLSGGVWQMSSSWQEEHYASAAMSEVREARLGWTNWSAARLRVTAGTGIARWSQAGTAALFDAAVEYRPLNDLTALEAATGGAVGSTRPFSTLMLAARWRAAPRAAKVFGSAGVWRASSDAPPDRWPGAGEGQARPLLLRAHPLLGNHGRIDGPVFGRTVAHATIEAEHGIARHGLMTIGLATFADAARAWRRQDATASPLHIDVGLGLRLRVAPGVPAVRLDFARGLRDGHVAFTAGWQVTWWMRGTR